MSIDNENKSVFKERQPLMLLKNRSYPTYQLLATVSSKIDAENAMVIAILETLSWLRKRFRDLKIPREIIFPEPDEYESVSLDNFKSFRINEGYVVDVVFIKDKGIWAFHLIEPDLGPEPGKENQKRAPVPGRVFETNIAFRIYNDKLECGFKTVCSEPASTKAVCEVFRLAVVKSMALNKMLGLEQIIPIIREPHIINSNDKVEKIIDFIRSKERQLPFVLTVEYKEEVNIDSVKKDIDFDINELVNRSVENLMAITKLEEANEKPFESNLQNTIKHRMGYAHFGLLPYKYIDYFNSKFDACNIESGEVHIFYPVRYKLQDKNYSHKFIKLNEEHFIKKLEDELQDYPKYKNMDYGNVMFINEARMEELQSIINMSNDKEEIVRAYEEKIKNIKIENENKIYMLNNVISEKDEKIERLNKQISQLELKNGGWQQQVDMLINSHEQKINKLNMELLRKDQLMARPRKTEDIPGWVEKHFADKLIFHSRAIDEISKTPTKEVDMKLLCDAIEYLAHEYRDERIGSISIENRDKICSAKYNRCFNVTPTGDMSIKNYPKEYKVKYAISYTGKLKEVPLDIHLKVGNDNKNLLRIYFFYDKEKNLVVVGSLPGHLKAISK